MFYVYGVGIYIIIYVYIIYSRVYIMYILCTRLIITNGLIIHERVVSFVSGVNWYIIIILIIIIV